MDRKVPGTDIPLNLYKNFDLPDGNMTPPPLPPNPNNFKGEPQQEYQQSQEIYENLEPQESQEGSNEEYESYDEDGEYGGGNSGLMYFGMKVAGILLVLLVMFTIWKFVSGKKIAEERRLENLVKLNPSGGYYDGTKGNNNKAVVNVEDSESYYQPQGSVTPSNIVTEIMQYTKDMGKDGRPYLTLSNDNYGTFDIHIPLSKYETLNKSGYLLADMEINNNKVTFIYISSKQENLENLINK